MKIQVSAFLALLFVAPISWSKEVNSRRPSTNLNTTTTTEAQKPRILMGVEPLYLLIGGIGARTDYLISDKVSIGLSGIYVPSHDNIPASSDAKPQTPQDRYKWYYNELLLSTNFMLTGTNFTNGVYLKPSLGYMSSGITDYSEYKLQGNISSPMARLIAGYQFVNLRNHIRLALGAGVAAVQNSDIVVKDADGTEVLRQKSGGLSALALEINFGIIF